MSQAASTASRSSLGWQIPADEWDAFVSYVGAEWSDDDETVRYELERAMIEFIDTDDDLVAAEKLLRDARDVRGVSSSTADALTRDVDREQKRKIGVRVRDDVQDSFRAHVSKAFNDGLVARYSCIDSGHTTYADALTAALSEYRDGGTGRRIRALAEEVITGESDRGRNSIFVESDQDDTSDLSTAPAVSTTPSSRVILDVAEIFVAAKSFPASQLTDEIQQHAGEEHDRLTDELVDQYREAIVDELSVVEHPFDDRLYLTEEERDNYTAWSDLDKQGRVRHFRQAVIVEADESGDRRKSVTYTEAINIFDKHLGHKPSNQYAYDVMEAAASVDGFYYTTTRGDKQLRVDRQEIPDSLRAGVITNHDIIPVRKTAKEAEPEESGNMDTREADESAGNPQGEAAKNGTNEANNWVTEAVNKLPPGDVADLPDRVIDNKIARARYVDDDGDLDNDGNVLQSRLDRVSSDDRQRVRERASATDDTLDALEQATPAAMTDGGSNTDRSDD